MRAHVRPAGIGVAVGEPCLPCCYREAVLDALSPLGSIGSGIADGKGAIYLWARLPEGAVAAAWA